MRKDLTKIIKSENLKPKELALLLLTDIHENTKTGKDILAQNDKDLLIQRVKSFENKTDCDLYNSYVRSFFAVELLNIDVRIIKEQLTRCYETSVWMLKHYAELGLVLLLDITDEEIKKHISESRESIPEKIRFYVSSFQQLFSRLLAYQKVTRDIASYTTLDVDVKVNKIVEEYKKDANEIDNLLKIIKSEPLIKIDVESIKPNAKELDELYNLDLKEDFKLKFLKQFNHREMAAQK